MGIHTAAQSLPRALYLIDLLLLYVLTCRLAASWTGSEAILFGCFDLGHLAVLLFGLNVTFFVAASFPYTEALAFLLVPAALLALDRRWYFAAGGLAGLAFLTRLQMLGFVIAALAAVVLVVRRVRPAALFVLGTAVVVIPWILWLATFIRPITPAAFLAGYHPTPEIPLFDQLVPARSVAGLIADRAGGLLVAFDPRSPLSFFHSFGAAAVLVPLGAIHAVFRPRRPADSLLPIATLLSGIALTAMLLLIHSTFFLPWLFGYRHGLPFVLLLLLALVELWRGVPAIRWPAMVVVLVTAMAGLPPIVRLAVHAPSPWPPPAEAGLRDWLAAHDPQAVVLSTRAQELSAVTRANFRWAACNDDPNAIRLMLTAVRTDYVAVFEGEQRCPFLKGTAGVELRPAAVFGSSPRRIFLLRVMPPRANGPDL